MFISFAFRPMERDCGLSRNNGGERESLSGLREVRVSVGEAPSNLILAGADC